MRELRRILFHLLGFCVVLFVIINWYMTWTFPKRLLYKKLSSELRSQIHNDHKITTYGGTSTNHREEHVVRKEWPEIIFVKEKKKKPKFKPVMIDRGDWKASRVEDLVAAIMKLAGYKAKNRIASSLRKALGDLPRLPVLPSPNAEDRILTTVVPPAARVTYDKHWDGLRLPVISCKALGRLGNMMGEYATMYALRKLYNVSIVVDMVMRAKMSGFRHLSLPILTVYHKNSSWTRLRNSGAMYNYASLELAASGLLGPHKFSIQGYPFEIQLFQNFREELKQEFSFSFMIKRKVQQLFKDIRKRRRSVSSSELVFVGFHIRRTDYRKYAAKMFGVSLPGETYFNRSLEYYRNKFPPGRVVFLAASDDPTFLQQALGKHADVIIVTGEGPSVLFDLAVLSSCNHSIITMGSFGFWTGFLAGGEVVYPDIKSRKIYRFSRYMFEKVGLHNFTPLPVD